ncbi:MAG TPA: lysophospholipid acyltransferase family protein [Pseudolabrys sp.]|nr:lysophospholipid acyltransferase family protein [Pseudolabrys sp.]
MLRSLFVGVVFFTTVAMLATVQWLLKTFKLPGRGRIAVAYYGFLCRLLGIRVRVVGTPVLDRPALMISNHTSWADILAIGSTAPVAFVAKSEVRKWPVIGTIAHLQRTVFVDRQRRQQTGDAIGDMVQRLSENVPVVLFAEGTSSDGNHVLPFRSALVGAVRDAGVHAALKDRVVIQPLSICYTGVQGLPLGRQHRHLTAWCGDLDLMPHLSALIRRGGIDAVVTFGEPLAAEAEPDRKRLTRRLEDTVRRITAYTLRGRPEPEQAA